MVAQAIFSRFPLVFYVLSLG